MDQNAAALVPLLPGYFGWNFGQNQMPDRSDYRVDQGQDRQFHAVSHRSSWCALKSPKYKRIQRLFRTFPLDFSTVARFIVRQLPDGQYLLTLDRTNWKFGQPISIFCAWRSSSKVW